MPEPAELQERAAQRFALDHSNLRAGRVRPRAVQPASAREPQAVSKNLNDAVGSVTFGPQSPAAESFASRLLRVVNTRTDSLTPLECRLLQVAKTFFPDMLLYCRIPERPVEGQGLNPLTPEVVGRAAKLALVAAIEAEQHLRDLRGALEERQG